MIDMFAGRGLLDYVTDHGMDPMTIEECIDIIQEDEADTSAFSYPKEFASFDDYASFLIAAEHAVYDRFGQAVQARNPEKLKRDLGITAETYTRETVWQTIHRCMGDAVRKPGGDVPEIAGFAVYCKEDRSLTFYSGSVADMPAAGGTYRGKAVASSYLIDNKKMWQECRKRVYQIIIADPIVCPPDIRGWFAGFLRCKSMDLSKLDTSHVTDMSEMFMECESLVELDLSTFDTSSVINARGMFSGCPALKKLDFPYYKKYRTFREGSYKGMSDPEVREDRRRRHAILRKLDEMGYPLSSESSAACVLFIAKPEYLEKNFPGLEFPYHAKTAEEYAKKALEREALDYAIQGAPYATNPQMRSYHPEGRW